MVARCTAMAFIPGRLNRMFTMWVAPNTSAFTSRNRPETVATPADEPDSEARAESVPDTVA
jgi:hypothetical protein